MSKYDWSGVKDEIKFIVTEPEDKLVIGMTNEPEQFDFGWSGLGDWFILDLSHYQGDWRDSLEQRPQELK